MYEKASIMNLPLTSHTSDAMSVYRIVLHVQNGLATELKQAKVAYLGR